MIVVVDFGSQTTHLIKRRFKDLSIKTKIVEPDQAMSFISNNKDVKGIVLSGGPSSVYEKNAPVISKEIFDKNIPILAICYGWQLTAYLLKGEVKKTNSEYGPTKFFIKKQSPLFNDIKDKSFNVWMSHGDTVLKLPYGFDAIGYTQKVQYACVENKQKNIYGLQFHPEVFHTQNGLKIIENFAKICGEEIQTRKLDVSILLDDLHKKYDQYKDFVAISAVSGGVDSTVASFLMAKIFGKNFVPIYCDNGLMRIGTKQRIKTIFKSLDIKPLILDCKKEFLEHLKGVVDPEKKRKIIGKLYIDNFTRASKSIKNVRFLVQGTIYSDVIESKGSKNASKIKSHHNVGGLPENLEFELIEPIRKFYKDEVKILGRQLGLPEDVINGQPFPGPGQAIRIIGEVNEKRLEKQQKADQIVLDVLKKTGWYDKVFQSFPIMTGINTTAVKGDSRAYAELVGLRIYQSSDIMTAGWARLPYDVLQEISSRIVNEVPDVSRVVYDITTKPPATMEWE